MEISQAEEKEESEPPKIAKFKSETINESSEEHLQIKEEPASFDDTLEIEQAKLATL